MTERKTNMESPQTPADIATLYSWANLHGARYRDFSDSRQQMRAQNRHRILTEQEMIAREAAEQPTEQNAGPLPVPELPLPVPAAIAAAATEQTLEPVPPLPLVPAVPAFSALPTAHPVESLYTSSLHEQSFDHRSTWEGRPAWFSGGREHDSFPASRDTLQYSREDVASRWFALKGVFERGEYQEPHSVRKSEQQAPALAVFSLAGGVGKTSLVATLGRALAARGERTLLVDTTAHGLLPFYFGARDLSPNTVRTFSGATEEASISVFSFDGESAEQERMVEDIQQNARSSARILIDVQTGSLASMRRLLRLAPVVLVPIVPDMNSVITLQRVEKFFRAQQSATGNRTVQPWYVLNQFDASLPLHLDIREVLRQQLGERLLPLSIGRTSGISEALAEGMTLIDYGTDSPAIQDFLGLSEWLCSISPSASNLLRPATRWCER